MWGGGNFDRYTTLLTLSYFLLIDDSTTEGLPGLGFSWLWLSTVYRSGSFNLNRSSEHPISVKINVKQTSRVLKDEDYPSCLSAALMERQERFRAVTWEGIQTSERWFQEKAQFFADQRVSLGNPLFSGQKGCIMFRELGSLQTRNPSGDQTWEFVLTSGLLFRRGYLYWRFD